MRLHPCALAVAVALCALSLVCVLPARADGILYVKADAAGANDGSSWADAFTGLQSALDVALSGHEVWVAQGVYTPTPRTDPVDARSVTFVITNGVALYGGFAGVETVREQRDWVTHVVTLRGDNAHWVVAGSHTDASAVLDGFTITGGRTGMAIEDGSPTVAHCAFSGNRGGDTGGMYISGGSPTLTNCTFSGNRADWGWGGAMYISGGSPKLTNCTFSGNNGGWAGGGVFNSDGSPTLTHCTFSGNRSSYDGGGMYTSGGNPTLTYCTFSGNLARRGAGIFMEGGNPTLAFCTFSGNDGWGGIYTEGGNPTLANCTFSGNSGGGVCISDGRLMLTGCIFQSNSASRGGGVCNVGGHATLANCTLQGNTAREGGGLYCESGSSQVRNSVVWDNGGEQIHIAGTVVVSNTLMQGGCPPGAQCEQVLDADPRFVDPAHGDLRLGFGSSAIDAGNDAYVSTATDLEGNARIQGVHVDLGAYESAPGVGIVKTVVPTGLVRPGTPLSYTLTYGNTGPLTATSVVITDLVPSQVLQVGYQTSGVPVTATAGACCVWQVADLTPGARGIITLTGIVSPELHGPVTFTNTVRIASVTPKAVTLGSHSNVATRVTLGGTRIYVKADAAGADDGSSWADAFTGLPSALDVALSGHEIWVAQGIYTPTLRTDPVDACSVAFVITDGVALYGGFAGVETALGQRDWITHTAMLTGQLGALGYGGDNAYRVVTSPHTDVSAVLDGFTIADGENGMTIEDGSPTLTNCTFSGNWGGGGLYIRGGSPTLTHCTFNRNFANYGGGMYISGGSPTLTDCTFSANYAYPRGGGMYIEHGSPTLTHCTFNGNYADYGAGGLYVSGGNPTLTNCTFTANDARQGDGGGMGISGGSPTMEDCTFSGNRASSGGGVFISDGSPTLTNCTFSENTARADGGGISGGSPTLTNCTLQGNSGREGGGLYCAGGSAQIRNSVLWDNGVEQVHITGAAVLSHTLVQGGCPPDAECAQILDADPRFVNPANGDLHLRFDSPAIDAGSDAYVTTATDLDGNARIQGAHVDLGAYETTPGVGIVKAAICATPLLPGMPLTYTLAFGASGPLTATHVLITDVTPLVLRDVAYHTSGVVVTPTGGLSYTWQVADLAPGMCGVITLTGVVDARLAGGFVLTNTARISALMGAADVTSAASTVVVRVAASPLYLPLISR